jgi:hypothetical protein
LPSSPARHHKRAHLVCQLVVVPVSWIHGFDGLSVRSWNLRLAPSLAAVITPFYSGKSLTNTLKSRHQGSQMNAVSLADRGVDLKPAPSAGWRRCQAGPKTACADDHHVALFMHPPIGSADHSQATRRIELKIATNTGNSTSKPFPCPRWASRSPELAVLPTSQSRMPFHVFPNSPASTSAKNSHLADTQSAPCGVLHPPRKLCIDHPMHEQAPSIKAFLLFHTLFGPEIATSMHSPIRQTISNTYESSPSSANARVLHSLVTGQPPPCLDGLPYPKKWEFGIRHHQH